MGVETHKSTLTHLERMDSPHAPLAAPRTMRPKDDTTPRWWAMSATFNRSMQAQAFIDETTDAQAFVPMVSELKVVGGKKTRRRRPAVSNLIFVRATDAGVQRIKDRLEYLQFMCNTEGGRRIRIVVPDKQMDDFIAVAGDAEERAIYFDPAELHLQKGDRVRIHGGVFDGVEGHFVKVQGRRRKMVVVSLPVAAVATLSFAPEMLEKLSD